MKIESVTQWRNKSYDQQEGRKFILADSKGHYYLSKVQALAKSDYWVSDYWLKHCDIYTESFRLVITYDKT